MCNSMRLRQNKILWIFFISQILNSEFDNLSKTKKKKTTIDQIDSICLLINNKTITSVCAIVDKLFASIVSPTTSTFDLSYQYVRLEYCFRTQ